MFKRFVLPAACFALIALGSACGDNGASGNFELAASIDGANFKGQAVQASLDSVTMTVTAGSGSQIMTLQILVPAAPGTVTLSGTDAGSYAEVLQGDSRWSSKVGGSGTVTFTAITRDVARGSFSFTAPRAEGTLAPATRSVTNGTFTVQF